MTRRPILLVALLAALLVGGFLVYDQFLAGDDVPPLTLPSASPGASVSPGASATPAPSGGTATAGELAGEWSVSEGTV
ncbi:MAG TPA: hypothetical protein VFC71_00310, partial [Candidatus Polarisedimenticolia bacterium]|nr:hypothetical protein [Candidatus Polarisedimenticolia bacterium]